VWPEAPAPTSVVDLDLVGWTARVETGMALWFAALAVACARCRDGGQVVAVTDRPEPKDCAGWALESALSDAVEVMVRSLAQVEGGRGVRVNVVSTAARLCGDPDPWGRVVDAVAMLLTAGGPGVTAEVIRVAR
jgi:NAD(P)-dependent dehydrogenase (short-subunit alcohol dehydrogenase family)